MGQYLDIPSSFDQTIEAFEALLPETQKIFLVASSWFQHASRVFHLSHSASFVALTLAIEALLPKATTDGICECCKREKRKGPTSLFKEFLSKFAPHQQIDKEYTKRLSDFYRVRSKIVHEGGYLRSDRSLFGELAFGDMDDWTLRIHLSRCVQIALVNWLLSSAAKTHT